MENSSPDRGFTTSQIRFIIIVLVLAVVAVVVFGRNANAATMQMLDRVGPPMADLPAIGSAACKGAVPEAKIKSWPLTRATGGKRVLEATLAAASAPQFKAQSLGEVLVAYDGTHGPVGTCGYYNRRFMYEIAGEPYTDEAGRAHIGRYRDGSAFEDPRRKLPASHNMWAAKGGFIGQQVFLPVPYGACDKDLGECRTAYEGMTARVMQLALAACNADGWPGYDLATDQCTGRQGQPKAMTKIAGGGQQPLSSGAPISGTAAKVYPTAMAAGKQGVVAGQNKPVAAKVSNNKPAVAIPPQASSNEGWLVVAVAVLLVALALVLWGWRNTHKKYVLECIEGIMKGVRLVGKWLNAEEKGQKTQARVLAQAVSLRETAQSLAAATRSLSEANAANAVLEKELGVVRGDRDEVNRQLETALDQNNTIVVGVMRALGIRALRPDQALSEVVRERCVRGGAAVCALSRVAEAVGVSLQSNEDADAYAADTDRVVVAVQALKGRYDAAVRQLEATVDDLGAAYQEGSTRVVVPADAAEMTYARVAEGARDVDGRLAALEGQVGRLEAIEAAMRRMRDRAERLRVYLRYRQGQKRVTAHDKAGHEVIGEFLADLDSVPALTAQPS